MNPVTSKMNELKNALMLILLLALGTLNANNLLNNNIHGKSVVCKDATELYSTEVLPNHTYNWSLSTGGTVLTNGNSEVSVLWDLGAPGSGPHILYVTITDQGGTQTTHSLEVFFQEIFSLSCDNIVNVSLGLSGEAEIFPSTLLNNNFNNFENFEVEVTDIHGKSFGNTVDCNHLEEEMIGKVTDLCSGNACWSYLVVEDKTGPTFDCPIDPIELSCDEDFEYYPNPTYQDNCSDHDEILIVFLGQTIDDSNVCDEVWVTKYWLAIDEYGNETECEQVIRITSPDLIDFPSDITWTCDEYSEYPTIMDATPITDSLNTTGSGVPSGVDGLYCAYNVSLTADTLSSCGNTFKIIRTWLVFNWCTGLVVLEDKDGEDNEQLIEIMDNTAPIVTLPSQIINANNTGSVAVLCYSTDFLPAPQVEDNCSDYTIKIFTPIGELEYVNGVDGSEGGYIPFPGLVIGNHFVTYQAIDDCGNVGESMVLVQVKDLKEPNAICDFITDVSLTNTGEVEMFAETLDDGSYDNCCIDRFEAKRMDAPNSAFAESIIFDCSDDVETVVFRVYDCFDNFNECMVEVVVKDKLIPVCLAPADLTVTCLDIPIGLELDDSETLENLFGSATDYDNCGSTLEELSATGSIYCGEGSITRQFVSTDIFGNLSASCFQHITIEGTSQWSIHFPADWTGECGSPDNSNEVIVENDGCDLFAISYSDQLYNVSSDSACTQILRTWEIINWCDYIPNSTPLVIPRNINGDSINHITHGNFFNFSYQQTIWITDGDAPIITYNGEIDFCSLDDDCSTGEVEMPIDIQDECTDDLHLTYELDLNRDDAIDGTGLGEFVGTLPLGSHRLKYAVVDGCGNESSLEIDFTVIDCKKPSPYCENGIIVEIMQTGMIEIWAEDLNFNSYDNCPGELIFSFSSDTTATSRVFDCDYISSIQPVQVWVTDAAGNQDFCNSFINIQDNLGHCNPMGNPLIAGILETESGEMLSEVEVSLNDGQNYITDPDGTFEFLNLTSGGDYTVSPEKNVDPLNGVSTYDLVLMTKHILSTQLLNSPYKMIAADVNRSNTITTFDLVELRKLILHINDDFTNNTSWRFVEKAYNFQDPQNPLSEQFPETIDINNLDQDILNADFIAIKVGDVNGNAQTDDVESSDDRNFEEELFFQTENIDMKPKQTYRIDIKAKDFESISGFQFTLNFDPGLISFQQIIPSLICQNEHFGLKFLKEGIITVSWHNAVALTLNDGDIIMSFEIESSTNSFLKEVLEINSNLTQEEAYQIDDSSTNTFRQMGVELIFDRQDVNESFELFQNIPNPFHTNTVIGFNLPAASEGSMTVFDISGKILWRKEGALEKGYNEILLKSTDLPQSGVLFYQLETPDFVGTKKMILGSIK
ncbi:MAG: T9SS type A sorting domain-containing protein [Saprospiraceae bacterium]|jgi:hypothetical protein|nr:T9SS type A sorting domain-containing protein [Saprospiraceae bacterium]